MRKMMIALCLTTLILTVGCKSEARKKKETFFSEVLESHKKHCPDTAEVLLKNFARACVVSTVKAGWTDFSIDSAFCIPYCKRFEVSDK